MLTWNFEEIFFPPKFCLSGEECRHLCGRLRRTGEFSWALVEGWAWLGVSLFVDLTGTPGVSSCRSFSSPSLSLHSRLVAEFISLQKEQSHTKCCEDEEGCLGRFRAGVAHPARPGQALLCQHAAAGQLRYCWIYIPESRCTFVICLSSAVSTQISWHGAFQRAKAHPEVVLPKVRHLEGQRVGT